MSHKKTYIGDLVARVELLESMIYQLTKGRRIRWVCPACGTDFTEDCGNFIRYNKAEARFKISDIRYCPGCDSLMSPEGIV